MIKQSPYHVAVAAFPSWMAHLGSSDVITVVVTGVVVVRHAVCGAARTSAIVMDITVHFHLNSHSKEYT